MTVWPEVQPPPDGIASKFCMEIIANRDGKGAHGREAKVTIRTDGPHMFDAPSSLPKLQFRTLVLSDLHLGSSAAKPEFVWRFLQRVQADCYILAGDILDLWLPPVIQWGAAEQAVLDHLRGLATSGARVIYLRGNHDPDPESAPPEQRLPFLSQDDHVHITKTGMKFLVTHGHQFDLSFLQSPILARIGSAAEQGLHWVDRQIGRISQHGAGFSKSVTHAYNRLSNWQADPVNKQIKRAIKGGHDGVLCGHFHQPALCLQKGIIIGNAGDWLTNLTALAEDREGRLHLIKAPVQDEIWTTAQPIITNSAASALSCQAAPQSALM